MITQTDFQTMLKGALRPNWWLRAAALKQFLRQQLLCRRISSSVDNKPTLLVYQMGKVGSTNLARDLVAQNSSINVFQIHRMDSGYIDRLYARYRANAEAPYYFSNYVGRIIYRQVIDQPDGPEVKILCAVREPIARNVSHFFQDIERFTPRNPIPTTIGEVQKIFVDRFEHDYPDQWFDEEFLPVTGIDVLGQGFDKEAGFQTYENGRIKALVYKIEATGSEAFVEAFDAFTGLSYQSDAKHNVGGNKKYGALYSAFKAGPGFPPAFCAAQHDTRYAKTFYTEDELAKARQKFCAA